jgi:hypothetical protein
MDGEEIAGDAARQADGNGVARHLLSSPGDGGL